MPEPGLDRLRWMLAGGLLFFAAAGLAVTTFWLVGAKHKMLFPPSRRPRRIPWTGAEILLALVLMASIPSFVFILLKTAGFFRWQYGADPVGTEGVLYYRGSLWAAVLGNPLVVVAIVAAVRFASGTKLRHLGLTCWRWLPSLASGFLFWLPLTAPLLGLHLLLVWFQTRIGLESKEHAFVRVLDNQAKPAEWVMVVLAAVVVAPALEELFFRGLLLPWLAKRPGRWLLAWAAAMAAVTLSGGRAIELWLPVLFVLIAGMLGLLVTAREVGPRWPRQAILGSALLFASVHAPAWPSPIPLFLLALGLGWLAHCSRSLIGPIVLHSLFNSVSTFLLLTGWVKE